jgi:hypothetical protein
MAKQISNFFHIFVILVLVAAGKYISTLFVKHCEFFFFCFLAKHYIFFYLLKVKLKYNMKPNFHFIFLLLLQVWNIGLQQVDGADHPCKTPLGICGGDCDKRCKKPYTKV